MINPHTQYNAQELATLLNQKGINTLEQESEDSPQSPWYVKTIAIISGWLAALCVFIFLAISLHDLLEKEGLVLVLGLACVTLSFFLFRSKPSDFIEHAAITVSLVGQLMILIDAARILDSSATNPVNWALMLAFHLLLLVLIPNNIHRYLSAFFASLTLAVLFANLSLSSWFAPISLLIIAMILLNEFKLLSIGEKRHNILSILAYSLCIQFLLPNVYATYVRWFSENQLSITQNNSLYSDLGLAPTLLIITAIVLKRYSVSLPIQLFAFACALLFSIVSVEISMLSGSVALIALGFANSNLTLHRIGILSLLINVSFYYYNLEATLLTKSIALASFGILALSIRWCIIKISNKAQQKNGDEHA